MPRRTIKSEERIEIAVEIMEALAAAPDCRISAAELCRRFDIDGKLLTGIVNIIASLADRESGARSVCYETENGFVVLGSEGTTMLPLRLTAAEGAVLDRELEGLGLSDEDAGRIRTALLPRELGYSYHVETAAAVGAFWQPLHEAIEDGVRIRMGYRSLAEDAPSIRTVDPVRIFREGGSVYLAAWNVDKDAARIYRLDRITSIAFTDDSVELHADGPSTVAGSLGRAERTARLSMPAQRAESLSWPCIDAVEVTGDTATVTVRVASERWLFSQILAAAGEIVILDDPALAKELATFARELLQVC